LLIQYSGSRKCQEVCSWRLLYFRIFCAVYTLAILIWSFIRYAVRSWAPYWIIYATIWTLILVQLYFITSAVVHLGVWRYVRDHDVDLTNHFHVDTPSNGNIDDALSKQPRLQRLGKVSNALFAMSLTMSLGVTLLNWVIIDYSDYIEPGNSDDIAKVIVDVNLHGVLLCFMLIDYYLSMLYLPFTSTMYIVAATVLYLIWSLIYYVAGGRDPFGNDYIYPLLNWKYPQTAVPIAVCFPLLLAGMHWVFCWMKYKALQRYVTIAHLKRISVQERVHSSSHNSKQSTKAESEHPSNVLDSNGHDHLSTSNGKKDPSFHQLDDSVDTDLQTQPQAEMQNAKLSVSADKVRIESNSENEDSKP